MKKFLVKMLLVVTVVGMFSGMVVVGYCADDTEPRSVIVKSEVK